MFRLNFIQCLSLFQDPTCILPSGFVHQIFYFSFVWDKHSVKQIILFLFQLLLLLWRSLCLFILTLELCELLFMLPISAISHFYSKFHYDSPTASKAISRGLEEAKRSCRKPLVSLKKVILDHLLLLSTLAYSSSCSLVFLRTIWQIFIEFFGLLFNERDG